MHKTMILLIPLLVIGAFAGDCSNPLLKTFGFVGFSTPTTVSGLKYCKSLQSGQSCCSDSIINNFQVKTNQTQTRLLQMVAARDQALADTRIQFIGDFNDVAVSFTQAATKAIPKLQQQGSLSTDGVSQLLTISQGVLNNLNTLRANFQSYQAARTVCVAQMIKIQAAAWCLACDPDYASKGVSSGPTVSISDNLCAGIENSCFDYIQKGADQSLVLQFRALLTLFQRLTNSLYQIAEGKVGIQLRLDTPDMPSSNTLKPNVMPSNCYDYGDCEWACATLFTNGNINEVLLGNGGASFGYAISSNDRRLEKEDSLDQPRILLNSQWNPDIDEAGVIVQFDQNPGNVFATRITSLKSILFVIFFVLFIL